MRKPDLFSPSLGVKLDLSRISLSRVDFQISGVITELGTRAINGAAAGPPGV